MTKDFIAKGEWIYKGIFTADSDEKKRRVLNIESDNDFDGRKRTILENYYAECVLIIFYQIDKVGRRELRKRFVIESPIFRLNSWPQITPEIELRFNGMD